MTNNAIRDLVEDLLNEARQDLDLEFDGGERDLYAAADDLFDRLDDYINGLEEEQTYSRDKWEYNGVAWRDFV